MRIRAIGIGVTAVSSLLALGIIVFSFAGTMFSGPAAIDLLPGLLLLAALIAWTQSASLILLWLLLRHRSQLRTYIVAAAALLTGGCSVIGICNAFVFHPNPQSALIVLFLPVLQWIVCGITLLADVVAARHESPALPETIGQILKFRALQCLLLTSLLFTVWWLFQRPSNARDWAPNLVRLPRAVFDGDHVTINSIRDTRYRTASDYTPSYYERTFDLRQIRTIDFIMVPFESTDAMAHTFVTFGFANGQQVAISAEVRRERGESYSPLRGLLRQCELMYVIASERDLILLRTRYRKDRVYLYPIRASPEKCRDMFVSMLQRANQLRREPEFYNSLTNNCTTSLLKHFNHVRQSKLAVNLKVLFPGYSDRLVYDLGIIDTPLDFDSLKTQSDITDRANSVSGGAEFSRRIRE